MKYISNYAHTGEVLLDLEGKVDFLWSNNLEFNHFAMSMQFQIRFYIFQATPILFPAHTILQFRKKGNIMLII